VDLGLQTLLLVSHLLYLALYVVNVVVESLDLCLVVLFLVLEGKDSTFI
jgi:hypothetical protein